MERPFRGVMRLVIFALLCCSCSVTVPDSIGVTECGWTEFELDDLQAVPDTECVRVSLVEGSGAIADSHIRPCDARENEPALRCVVGRPSDLHGYGPDDRERVHGTLDRAQLVDGACPLACD
jgi:hypothetical protein